MLFGVIFGLLSGRLFGAPGFWFLGWFWYTGTWFLGWFSAMRGASWLCFLGSSLGCFLGGFFGTPGLLFWADFGTLGPGFGRILVLREEPPGCAFFGGSSLGCFHGSFLVHRARFLGWFWCTGAPVLGWFSAMRGASWLCFLGLSLSCFRDGFLVHRGSCFGRILYTGARLLGWYGPTPALPVTTKSSFWEKHTFSFSGTRFAAFFRRKHTSDPVWGEKVCFYFLLPVRYFILRK